MNSKRLFCSSNPGGSLQSRKSLTVSTGSHVCQFKTEVMVHHWTQNREKSYRNIANYNAIVAVLTCFILL